VAVHLAIVGNSAAALSALEAFRARDRASWVTLVSSEPGPAYSRVLLPYFLRGRVARDDLFIRPSRYYESMDARTLFGTRVEAVDVHRRRLELSGGDGLDFDRLLVATGSSPSKPPIPGLEGPRVHHLWTLEDALRLDELLRPGARALVLGAGFVALQAAWAARRRGLEVTVVELAEHVLPRVLDEPAARLLEREMVAQGLTVHTATRTEAVEHGRDGALRVVASGLDPLDVDVIIVGTGIRPNAGLLPQALEADAPGIPVDETMSTVIEGVYAAGDVARGPVCAGGPREIHALWPTAVEQGRVAGANLAGAGVAYAGSLSMNVTEMFGVTVASLGRIVEGPGDQVEECHDLPPVRYLKVVSREGVPAGAVALGGPDVALVLGRLRPLVRGRRPAPAMAALLEGSDLPRLLARGMPEAGYLWTARGPSREEARCASSS
jgi:NAD(P)H-nitrite reductase large subunit